MQIITTTYGQTHTPLLERSIRPVPSTPFSKFTGIHKIILEEQPGKQLQQTDYKNPNGGFVESFKIAHKKSLPLELRPDVFFIVIMQSLSKHIENNVEKYRHLFTENKDKELLIQEVGLDDYQTFIDKIGEQLRNKIKFDPKTNFSTATPISSGVNDITLMNVCKKYYDYMMMTLNCSGATRSASEGITSFHINGSIEDWNALIDKVNYIGKTFDLQFWTDYVAKVLSYIRNADPNDKTFWDNAYKYKGSETGWFLAFFLYTKDNQLTQWKKIGDFLGGSCPDQVTTTPFVYIRLGEKINMELLSGLCGVYRDTETNVISPCIGWAISEINSKTMTLEEEKDVIRHRSDAKYLHEYHFKF